MRLHRGTTLTQLLVASAIVALLAGILPPKPCLAKNHDGSADLDALAAKLVRVGPVAIGAIERTRPTAMVTVDCQRLTDAQKVTMMFLQGLANRRGPRLFLGGLEKFNVKADRCWVRHLEREYGVVPHALDWKGSLERFGPELSGLVVWDVKVRATQNIAGMLGSVFSWLPCAPDDLATVRQATGLGVACDVRGLWEDPVEAQRWALEHVVPKLSTEEIGCITTREPEVRLCRDWLIMRAAPMVDLSSRVAVERALKDDHYARLMPLSIVWGWLTADRDEHVEHTSRRGLRVICSTNSPNLSFLAQIRPKRTSWTQPHSRPLGELGKRAYLSFVLAAGDTASAMLTRQWGRWDEAARGHVPFAWEVQPLLARVAPVVLESYYDSASPRDRFICGPSGAGYAQILLLPNRKAFMEDAAALCATCDLGIVGLHTDFAFGTARDWATYFPAARGFVYGWDGRPEMPPRVVDGKPHAYYALMPEPPEGEKTRDYYEGIASEIRDYVRSHGLPSVALVHMFPDVSGPDDVAPIVECLGDVPVEVVPIDTAMEIARRIAKGPSGIGGGWSLRGY